MRAVHPPSTAGEYPVLPVRVRVQRTHRHPLGPLKSERSRAIRASRESNEGVESRVGGARSACEEVPGARRSSFSARSWAIWRRESRSSSSSSFQRGPRSAPEFFGASVRRSHPLAPAYSRRPIVPPLQPIEKVSPWSEPTRQFRHQGRRQWGSAVTLGPLEGL